MKKHKTIKKLASILLTVALINTSIPLKTVEATFLSDFLGGLFTIISAPIWIFCKDNPTFRKNNPFRKKPWQEEQDKLEIDKNEIDKNLRLSSRDLSYTSIPKYKEPPIDISANDGDASSPLKFTPKKHKRDLPLDTLDIEEVDNINNKENDKNSCINISFSKSTSSSETTKTDSNNHVSSFKNKTTAIRSLSDSELASDAAKLSKNNKNDSIKNIDNSRINDKK